MTIEKVAHVVHVAHDPKVKRRQIKRAAARKGKRHEAQIKLHELNQSPNVPNILKSSFTGMRAFLELPGRTTAKENTDERTNI